MDAGGEPNISSVGGWKSEKTSTELAGFVGTLMGSACVMFYGFLTMFVCY